MKKTRRTPTHADLIREVLERRPYWGPQAVARELGIDPHIIRVTASRHRIRFMDRADVEREMDRLVDVIESLEVKDVGQEVVIPET